jgi:hypothetical protein
MRPRHGSRDQRLGTSRANLRERARFRRLAGTHAVPAVDLRQAEAWRYLKRRAHNTPPTNHRRERYRALGCSKGSTCRIMIGALARSQATYACRGGQSQQEGTRAGLAGEGRRAGF